LQFCVNSHRSAGRIWLSRIGNVGIGNRRKRNVSGIFDGRRRWVRHRNFGWRRRWYVSRLMARLGRGRLGLLLPRVQVCQNLHPFRGVAPSAVSCRVGGLRARSRKRSFAERVPSNGRRFGQKPSPSRARNPVNSPIIEALNRKLPELFLESSFWGRRQSTPGDHDDGQIDERSVSAYAQGHLNTILGSRTGHDLLSPHRQICLLVGACH